MTWFKKFRVVLRADDDDCALLDYLPIQSGASNLAERLLIARKRHGRPFHALSKLYRTSPPSLLLRNLDEVSENAAAQQAARLRLVKNK